MQGVTARVKTFFTFEVRKRQNSVGRVYLPRRNTGRNTQRDIPSLADTTQY
jgi:hypothetical protein